MAVSSVIALRRALISFLRTRPAVLGALGGEKIYDEAPRGVEPPYLLLGDVQMRDWSATLSRGAEHFLTLNVLSSAHGVREALDIAQLLIDALDEVPLSLQGHALIDLRFLALETKRTQDGRFARASLRFRATTEDL